jgi:single-strand DNA-binding protein
MRLGRDAEARYLPDGQPIVTLSLAFNHGKKDDSGNRATQWVEGKFWGDYATKAAPNMLKGMLLHVVLEDMHMEEFKRRDGSPGFKQVARVQSFDYATPRQGDGQRDQPQQVAPAARQPVAAKPAPPPRSGFDDMSDDIPF